MHEKMMRKPQRQKLQEEKRYRLRSKKKLYQNREFKTETQRCEGYTSGVATSSNTAGRMDARNADL